MSMGMVPWLDQPVMLHSDRDPGECTMTPEQCAYKTGYWVNWYQADHRYALPTVAFFLVAVGLFTIGHLASILAPSRLKQTAGWSRLAALFRFLSYRSWRIRHWNTQSLGGLLLVAAGAAYFLSMTLGPRPYYWPNTREISFGNSPPIATRAGFMALACMPFLFVLGAKANPITALTGISSEKLNVWHNWVAWAMYVLALVHTFPFIVFHIWKGDIVMQWNMGGVWVTGVVALLAQTWLMAMSIPWIRNRYYEFFKAGHYTAALTFILFFFFHCDFRMSSWDYFIATAVLYTLCWAYAQCKMYFEHGVRLKARLYRETHQTLKISIDTAMAWSPGQHMYIRFLAGGLHRLTMHPFTICSVAGRG
ncbi:ferric reductase like transmembrane component-domain-containing protein, partial [Aspergillus karnatakaensis]|uniref:ferric reductase like transmembrane component-domain-containing protein n=1 Tax=Aspergillus karnatakaensis TaxID=1810916 RepID=UPI003CCE2407